MWVDGGMVNSDFKGMGGKRNRFMNHLITNVLEPNWRVSVMLSHQYY